MNRYFTILISLLISMCSALVGCSTAPNQRAPVVNLKTSSVQRTVEVIRKTTAAQVQKMTVVVSSLKSKSSVPVKPAATVKSAAVRQNTSIKPHRSMKQNTIPKHNARAPQTALKEPTIPLHQVRFAWPFKGPVLQTFQASHAKGIDIGGAAGNSVKASASGTVVYGGNGLKGYGNLIIIKHNEDFLTAYAHNEKLMVKEGDRVTLGQEIAKIGKTDTDRVKLHFEIRYKGKPVDPLRFLPGSK